MRPFVAVTYLVLLCLLLCLPLARAFTVQSLRVVHRYPHDPLAFTEGLCVSSHGPSTSDGVVLLESTGIWGASSLRAVSLHSGAVLHQLHLGGGEFAEGIAVSPTSPSIIQLTYQNHTAYAFPLSALFSVGASSSSHSASAVTAAAVPASSIPYPAFIHEGWGLASSLSSPFLHLSDGSSSLHSFLPPLAYSHSTTVYLPPSPPSADARPLAGLNELEHVRGEVWANVYGTRCIARIAASGEVVGVLRAGGEEDGLYVGSRPGVEVMNGIAWDESSDRLWMTGKLWPWLYEVEVDNNATDVVDGEIIAHPTTAAAQFDKACPTSEWTADDDSYSEHIVRLIQHQMTAPLLTQQ